MPRLCVNHGTDSSHQSDCSLSIESDERGIVLFPYSFLAVPNSYSSTPIAQVTAAVSPLTDCTTGIYFQPIVVFSLKTFLLDRKSNHTSSLYAQSIWQQYQHQEQSEAKAASTELTECSPPPRR